MSMFEPEVVDDLLAGVNDWRSVPDIVKLTFKALSDVVRVQGACLAEAQKTLASKASKAELQAMYKTISAEIVRSVADSRHTPENSHEFRADRGAHIGRHIESPEASSDFRKLVRDFYEFRSELSDLKVEMRFLDQEQAKLKENMVKPDESLELMDLKSFKSAFTTALHRKANKQEVDALRIEFELAVGGKADKVDIQNLQLSTDLKADRVLIENLANELRHKPDKADLERLLKAEVTKLERARVPTSESTEGLDHRWASVAVEIDQFMSTVRSDLDRIDKLTKAELVKKADSRELDRLTQMLSRKADAEALDALSLQIRGEIRHANTEEVRKSSAKLVREQTETLQRSEEKFQKVEDDFKVVRDRIKRDSQRTKVEIDEAVKVINQHQTAVKNDFATEFARLKGEIDRVSKQVKEIKSADSKKALDKKLQSKADVTVVTEALFTVQKDTAENLSELKAEFKRLLTISEKEIASLLARKANASDVREWLASKADTEALHQALEKHQPAKLDPRDLVARAEFLRHVETTGKTIADLSKELMLRSTIKDVCSLLDTKANADEVSSDLRKLKLEFASKLEAEDFEGFKDEQVHLNELVYAEACVIRLIWSSGLLRKDGRIVWDALNFNSCPENFDWQDDIVAETPGLYQIYWCFFASEVNEVVICINGQEVCTVFENKSQKQVPSQWLGKICGSSFSDYVSLPPKASVSLIYRGDSVVEGFIGLKKL